MQGHIPSQTAAAGVQPRPPESGPGLGAGRCLETAALRCPRPREGPGPERSGRERRALSGSGSAPSAISSQLSQPEAGLRGPANHPEHGDRPPAGRPSSPGTPGCHRPDPATPSFLRSRPGPLRTGVCAASASRSLASIRALAFAQCGSALTLQQTSLFLCKPTPVWGTPGNPGA